jgi:hypothetical protein
MSVPFFISLRLGICKIKPSQCVNPNPPEKKSSSACNFDLMLRFILISKYDPGTLAVFL